MLSNGIDYDERKGVSEKSQRTQEVDDLKELMNTDAGKRFFRRVLEKCGVFQNPMTGNSYTFFNCGKFEIGMFLTDEMIQSNEQAYLDILTINKGKKNDE